MKRQIFIVIIALLTFAVSANGQAKHKKSFNPKTGKVETKKRHGAFGDREDIYYGARIGLSFATLQSGISGGDNKFLGAYSSNRTGLDISAIIGFKLIEGLNFETGLGYIGKGGVKKLAEGNLKYSLDFMELPLIFKYRFDVGNDFHIEPLAGGYLALGVGGKLRDYQTRSVYGAFGSDQDKLRRFDGGLRFGCGAQFNVFYLELAYDFGLANISHDNFDGTHTRNFLLSAGVNF